MDKATCLFWQNFRAALLKEAKDLQELRAAKLQQAAEIKAILENETQKEVFFLADRPVIK